MSGDTYYMNPVAEILLEAFEKNADRTALHIDGERTTYAQLKVRAQERAAQLREGRKPLGLKAAPVILCGPHSTDEIVTVVAAILAGIPYVPISAKLPAKRREQIEEQVRAGVPQGTAYVIFTSGSTGEPKGVPISYDNLANFIRWIVGLMPADGACGERVLNQAALSFDLSVADLYYALASGSTWVAHGSGLWDSAEGMTKLFKDGRISVSVMTPSAMKLCLLENEFDSHNLPDYKCAYFCGERLEKKTARKLMERFPSLTLINAYGPTEAASAVCAVKITPEMIEDDGELPVGEVAHCATEVRVTDGEIILAGASVAGGYLANTLKEADCGTAFSLENGVHVYRTGDIGSIRDGLIYCDGRRDFQVKYKGYRIELHDIENNMNRIPGVLESAVIAVRNSDGMVRAINAFCVPDYTVESPEIPDAKCIDIEYVKIKLGEMLPDYMVPRNIRILDRLPMNANGKIDRKALEQL